MEDGRWLVVVDLKAVWLLVVRCSWLWRDGARQHTVVFAGR